MPNFTYFDENTKNTYIINVSEEELTKVNEGKNCITYIYIYLCFYTFMLIYYLWFYAYLYFLLCNFKKEFFFNI